MGWPTDGVVFAVGVDALAKLEPVDGVAAVVGGLESEDGVVAVEVAGLAKLVDAADVGGLENEDAVDVGEAGGGVVVATVAPLVRCAHSACGFALPKPSE